ncbi:HNH endonuclease [Pseudomonas protegens]|uniref:HNH endonuclease n=1 Tax=Pseudomonas protegens TaxID=380021 RepID=UPI001C8335F3|nr:HNH endonuclease [Pseudomonas protegens]
MRLFGERIAGAIADICPSQHPLYLHGQGRLKRSSFWPVWLREALFYRENGRCAECSNSLTGVFDTSIKPQIDHIVPISNGGTTDPTNLQILCEPCNKKKGNSSSQVGNYIYVPWEFCAY